MKAILVNYNFVPDWLHDYNFDYLIYDRSDDKKLLKDFSEKRIIHTNNVGNADYDKLCYLVDNYDDLPNTFLWGKTNLFKYISKEEFEKIKNNKEFTPLLTKDHKTYSDKFGVVCYYENGIYWERNDGWYMHQFTSNFQEFTDFARYLNLPSSTYLPFAPGGNYILTKERVHRYSKDFYVKMKDTLPYTMLPAEAHFCERIYYTLWS